MQRFMTSLAICLCVIVPMDLHAEVLGTATFTIDGSGKPVAGTLPKVVLGVGIGRVLPEFGIALGPAIAWEETWLDSSSVDTVLTESVDGYELYSVPGCLTNGVPEYAAVTVQLYSPSGSYIDYRTFVLEQSAFSSASVDFHGASITSYSLRLDELVFGIENPCGTPVRTVHCVATWIVEGTWNVATESTTWGQIKALYRRR